MKKDSQGGVPPVLGLQTLRNTMSAYSIYKRLTYDFPETDWAKYARGQLSQPGMLNLEMKLEEERLKSEILK